MKSYGCLSTIFKFTLCLLSLLVYSIQMNHVGSILAGEIILQIQSFEQLLKYLTFINVAFPVLLRFQGDQIMTTRKGLDA